MSPAPADHVIKVDIALKQSQFDQLERELYEGMIHTPVFVFVHDYSHSITVSDPDHARYGQHLSLEDVQKLVKPSDVSLNKVHEWLAEYGINTTQLSYSKAKDWISVPLPVATLERMLQTKYSIFQEEGGELAVRTHSGQWSLPQHLHEHIDLISPTNSFFRPKLRKNTPRPVETHSYPSGNSVHSEETSSHPDVATVCNTSNVDTLCLRTYYGTYSYIPQVPGKNRVALSDFLGESNNRSDTRIFLERFRSDAVSGMLQVPVNARVAANANNVKAPTPFNSCQSMVDLRIRK